MFKTKTWIVIIAILLLLSLGLTFFLMKGNADAHFANVYVDGQCIESIDLSKMQEAYTHQIDFGENESNLLQVEPGRIRILEATCPDKVCVNTGWISSEALPIVCLPHKLVIRVETTAKGR